MPTGFGKTAVQWNCIADALDDGIEKIVITAPTVGLVEQQRRMILERIEIDETRVSTYTGVIDLLNEEKFGKTLISLSPRHKSYVTTWILD